MTLDWYVVSSCLFYQVTLLFRANVSLYAHESASVFACLERPSSDETVQTLFNKFQSQRWGTKASLKDRSIEIRIVYQKSDIVDAILHHDLCFMLICSSNYIVTG